MRRIDCDRCPVRDVSVAGGLPLPLLDDFRACKTTAIYKPRQLLFHEGSEAAGLYVLCHGEVKIYQTDRFGRDFILGIARPGEILGEIGVSGDETYSATAEAIVESQASFFNHEQLARLLQLHPTTGLRLVGELGVALARARRKARDLAFKSAEGRFAELLLHLVENGVGATPGQDVCVSIAYSRREMAEMIGVSPETAIRLFGRLRDLGIVSVEHRKLTVHDVERLRRIARHRDIES